MSRLRSGGVELVGFQLVLPGNRDAWLEPEMGLSVLYGRNGAGKSSVIDEVVRIFRGGTRTGSRMILRIADHDANLGLSAAIVDALLDTKGVHPSQRIDMRSSEILDADADLAVQGVRSLFGSSIDSVSRDRPAEVEETIQMVAELAAMGLGAEPPGPLRPGWPSWFVKELKATGDQRPSGWEGALSTTDSDSLYETWDLTLPQGHGLLESLVGRESWTGLAKRVAATLENEIEVPERTDKVGELDYWVGEWEPTDGAWDRPWHEVVPDIDEHLARIVRGLHEIAHEGLVALVPAGSSLEPSWQVQLANRVPGPDSGLDGLASLMVPEHTRPEPERHLYEATNPFRREYWDSRQWFTNSPYRVAIGAPHTTIHELPFSLVNLNDEFDVGKHLGSLAKNTFETRQTYSDDQHSILLTSSGETEVESDGFKELQVRIDTLGEQLATLDLGLAGMRMEVAKLDSWLDGEPLSLHCLREGTEQWIEFESLSAAQQDWVRYLLLLDTIESSDKPTILVGDEPDRGVHERAAASIYRLLEGQGDLSLIATHSVAALRRPTAHLLHIDSSDTSDEPNGNVSISPIGIGSDVESAAQRLGTSPLDLLAMKRLLVLVEGAHDKAVVDELVGLSGVPNLAESVLVEPLLGVAKVANAGDAAIVTQFTDMHVLLVIDNGSTSKIEALASDISARMLNGESKSSIVRESGLQHAQRRASDEERYVFDLFGRLITRNIFDRFHFHAIPVGDVIELLPPAAFGLSESWNDLRAEHRAIDPRTGGRPSFKDWLHAEKSARISTPAVQRGIETLDSLSKELLDILRAIETSVGHADLDRFRNS